MARRWWLLVLAAGLVTWSGTLRNSFHYDDVHSIVDNIYVRIGGFDAGSLELLQTYFAEPRTFSVDPEKGMYRPLLVTSYALNHVLGVWLGLGGYHVVGYHVVNLALHLSSALLVCWLTSLLGGSRRARLLAGLLFVLHPVASEPVNYISSRSESLSVSFYLLGICLFLYAEQVGRHRWCWGSWVALAAGLLSKSTTITLPAALLLLDIFVISRRDLSRLWRRLLSHHVPGWIVVGLYLAIVTGNGWLGRSLAQDVRGLWAQALTQIKAAIYYLTLVTVPVHQSVEPQFTEQSVFASQVAVPLLLLLSLGVGATVWLVRGGHWRALLLLCWPILHLLPTVVVPLNVLVNERRAYGPLAILCVAAGMLLASVRWRQPVVRVLAVVGCAVLGVLSYERSLVWVDEFSLWGDAVRKAPQMSRAHLYLGNAHKDAALHTVDPASRNRHWQAASSAYATAYKESRDLDLQLRALNNRGSVHWTLSATAVTEKEAREEQTVAEEMWQAAVDRNPSYADAIVNLGSAALTSARRAAKAGRVEEQRSLLASSIEQYSKALRLSPNHSQAHSNLAVAYQDLGETEAAQRHYRHALRLTPRDALTRKNLADLLYRLALIDDVEGRADAARGRLVEARTFIRQALRLNPAVHTGPQLLQSIESQLQALQ